MSRAVQVLERTVNQNSFNDIAQDFKYWDDASDQFREGEGTLLPLWKFYPEKAKKKHVTSISWNPQYLVRFHAALASCSCCWPLPDLQHWGCRTCLLSRMAALIS